jgi:guanylate kinase
MLSQTPSMTPLSPVHGKLVLIIGPSGVGKSVILQRLRAAHPEIRFPRSATTRARRPGEGDDLYRFVSDAEFDDLLGKDQLLEWAVVHGGARYGTLVDEIIPFIEKGQTVLREVDVQGFESIRMSPLFAGDAAPYRLQSIFILPESKEQLIAHITKRAPIAKEELDRRIASMEKELARAELCDVRVTNREGKIDETLAEVERVIAA